MGRQVTDKKLRKWFVVPVLGAMVLVMNVAGIRLPSEVFKPNIQASGDGEAEEDEEEKESKYIALTFDDGPHDEYTPKLLEGLRKRGVHVSFFLIGENIEGNEDILRQMKADGHLIGNHSQSHTQFTKKKAAEACNEINRTNQMIYEITGESPSYIRPPFGSWSEELECVVPMTVALWDVDPLDWKVQNKDRIVRHILKHAEDGSIVLLHDVYGSSVDAALEVIDTLSRQGYNFVTVDELLID